MPAPTQPRHSGDRTGQLGGRKRASRHQLDDDPHVTGALWLQVLEHVTGAASWSAATRTSQFLGAASLLAILLKPGTMLSAGDSGRAASRDGFHQSICKGLKSQAAAQHLLRMLGRHVESLRQSKSLLLTSEWSMGSKMCRGNPAQL